MTPEARKIEATLVKYFKGEEAFNVEVKNAQNYAVVYSEDDLGSAELLDINLTQLAQFMANEGVR